MSNKDIDFKEMTLSGKLLEQIKVMFYSYPNIEAVMSEIISYMSYEASSISFQKIKDNDLNSYLSICGKDGGLNQENINSLTSENLGSSSNDNISYFGAGARTACKQWTEYCEKKYFYIMDSKTSIAYELGGVLGLKNSNALTDEDHIKKKFNIEIKDNHTYFILPWDNRLEKEDEDGYKKQLTKHFEFMYNKKLLSDNLNINYLGENLIPNIDLFNNPNPEETDEKKNRLCNEVKFKLGKNHNVYINDIFAVHKGFKVSLHQTYYENKDGSQNMRGTNGFSLRICHGDTRVDWYDYEKPTAKPYHKDRIIRKMSHINDEFTFSFEFVCLPGVISARRSIIAETIGGSSGSDVHGTRILMNGNFVTKDRITNFKLGSKYDVMLNLELTEDQYRKYASPQIVRNNKWDCTDELKNILENTYTWCQKKGKEWMDKHQDLIKEKEKEKQKKEDKKKQKETEEKLNLFKIWIKEELKDINSVNASIKLIENSYINFKLRKEAKQKVEQRKKEKQAEEERKEREKERKIRNKEKYDEEIKKWTEEMNDGRGNESIYYTSTKQQRQMGRELFPNDNYEIWDAGRTGRAAKKRFEEYDKREYCPLSKREIKRRVIALYDARTAEDNIKDYFEEHNRNLLNRYAPGEITGKEFYLTTEEELDRLFEKEEEKSIKRYAKDLENKKAMLKEKYPH